MTTIDPSIDQCQNDIPSMVMIDFKIRKNMLFTTSTGEVKIFIVLGFQTSRS